MNVFDITGKTALVVGAGGLGREIAGGLVNHGARVAVADVDLERAREISRELGGQGGDVTAASVNIVQEESVSALAESLRGRFGRLDILVNAAGGTVRKPAEELTLEDWDTVMELNARGVFITCSVFGRQMIRDGGGKIVNLSSVRGRFPSDFAQAEYSASKGAVDALTRALAAQWGRFGVYVNAVAPTVIETPLVSPLLEDEKFAARLRESIPLGRWGEPRDLVGPVLFLASPASDFVTGQILYVDGGLTGRI
ncbi:MAG: glucose 1-dehydrogenase [Thermoleophilia bacterium]